MKRDRQIYDASQGEGGSSLAGLVVCMLPQPVTYQCYDYQSFRGLRRFLVTQVTTIYPGRTGSLNTKNNTT